MGVMDLDPERPADQHEPMFNAPWPVMALIGVILAAFTGQVLLGREAVGQAFGFAPADLLIGRPWTLLTHIFVHGGWAHVIMNAAAILAFGPPVARLMGRGFGGAFAFLAFFFLCGVLAGLGYAAAHWGETIGAVGASGAASGLMGAASRLLGRRDGLWPLRSRPVLAMGLSYLAINLIFAVLHVAPGMPSAVIAWEAHLAGYVAGLVLIVPFARLRTREIIAVL